MARMMFGFVGAVVVSLALGLAPLAEAKTFEPGDVSVCGAAKCIPLNNRAALNALSAFYYSAEVPKSESKPPAYSHYVQLRYRNGYVTGIAAGPGYDHFLSYGVNEDQFTTRTWYAIPPAASKAIKKLATKLRPRPVPPDILLYSH
jgi:hypothetical protein